MHRARRAAFGLLGAAIVLVAVGGGCGRSYDGPTTETFVTDVASSTVTITYHKGVLPVGSAGPTLSLSGPVALVPGRTASIDVAASAAVGTVYVGIPGLPGYYQVVLPSAASTATVTLTLANSLPVASFAVDFTGQDAAGAVGPAAGQAMRATPVTTGAVQVRVSWDTLSDVDLHLFEPDGTEIYWGHAFSSDGGSLDHDSNRACHIDGSNYENITWHTGSPPHGTYTVVVDYYSACGVPGTTTYTVTVHIQGQTDQTYTGTFTAADADAGKSGSDSKAVTVTTFTY